MSDEIWLTVNEACARVKVTRRTLYNWMRDDRLTLKRTAGGAPRILEASLWRSKANVATDEQAAFREGRI